MALYVVGYDLQEGQDYEPLIDRLKKFDNRWHHLARPGSLRLPTAPRTCGTS